MRKAFPGLENLNREVFSVFEGPASGCWSFPMAGRRVEEGQNGFRWTLYSKSDLAVTPPLDPDFLIGSANWLGFHLSHFPSFACLDKRYKGEGLVIKEILLPNPLSGSRTPHLSPMSRALSLIFISYITTPESNPPASVHYTANCDSLGNGRRTRERVPRQLQAWQLSEWGGRRAARFADNRDARLSKNKIKISSPTRYDFTCQGGGAHLA